MAPSRQSPAAKTPDTLVSPNPVVVIKPLSFNSIISFTLVVFGINPIKIKAPSAVSSSVSPVVLSFTSKPLKFPFSSLINANDSLLRCV